MPVTPESVVAYLGIDLEKIPDDKTMRTVFDQSFLRREVAHDDTEVREKVFGKINAIARQRLKSGAKTIGVDIGNVDESDPLDLIVKYNEGIGAKLEELAKDRDTFKLAAEKGGGDVVEKLRKELDSVIKERDAFGSNAKDWETKFTGLNSQWTKTQEESKLQTIKDAAKAAIKFRDDIDPLTKKGFVNDFFERHSIDMAGDRVKILDLTGAPIMDKTTAQKFASLEVLMAEAADVAKLTAKSPQAGTPVRKVVVGASTKQTAESGANPGARRTREVMPRY